MNKEVAVEVPRLPNAGDKGKDGVGLLAVVSLLDLEHGLYGCQVSRQTVDRR